MSGFNFLQINYVGIHFSGLNFLPILRGNRLKPLQCLDLISGKSTTCPINAIPLEATALYWQYWTARANVHAIGKPRNSDVTTLGQKNG
jgi:hypothetical protein